MWCIDMELKEGDIYRWSWNSKELGKRKDSASCGTLYWCCSRIGIVDNKGRLVDTYSSYDPRTFSNDKISELLDVEFIANMGDLEKVDSSNRAYYLDSDCVDLNHSNNTRGNFYIRKGAKKSLAKMKKILNRAIKEEENTLEYTINQINSLKKDLAELTEESGIYVGEDVPLYDNCWLD